MSECKRCGQCCTWMYNAKRYTCPYLEGEIGKFTTCRIYNLPERVGLVVTEKPVKVKCLLRKEYPIEIKGCTWLQ